MWNGHYFVTLVLPDGTVRRQDAARPVPAGATVAATDNGMQGCRYYADMLRAIRAAHTPTEGEPR
jgi:hypothetical protein